MAEATVTTEVTGVDLKLTLEEAQQLRAVLGRTVLGVAGNTFDAITYALEDAGVEHVPYKVVLNESHGSIKVEEGY